MDRLGCSSPLCIAPKRQYGFWAVVELPKRGSHRLPISAFASLDGSIFPCCIPECITSSKPQLNQGRSGLSTSFGSYLRCRRELITRGQQAPHWPTWMHFLSLPRTQVLQFASPLYSAAQNSHSPTFHSYSRSSAASPAAGHQEDGSVVWQHVPISSRMQGKTCSTWLMASLLPPAMLVSRTVPGPVCPTPCCWSPQFWTQHCWCKACRLLRCYPVPRAWARGGASPRGTGAQVPGWGAGGGSPCGREVALLHASDLWLKPPGSIISFFHNSWALAGRGMKTPSYSSTSERIKANKKWILAGWHELPHRLTCWNVPALPACPTASWTLNNTTPNTTETLVSAEMVAIHFVVHSASSDHRFCFSWEKALICLIFLSVIQVRQSPFTKSDW